MGTTFSEILTQWAMQEIDDINWTRGLQENPAAFLRAKSDTLMMAVPRFSRPAEIQKWLTYTPPTYDSFTQAFTEDAEAPVVLETGITGMELCSGTVITKNANGTESYQPFTPEYDAETGNVTLDFSVSSGVTIDLDFYTDGIFDRELDGEQKRILGLCVAFQWYSRWNNTWLNMQPKIKDRSFDVGSESAQMTANTAKFKELRLALNDSLLRYEENVFYRQRLPELFKLKPPVG